MGVSDKQRSGALPYHSPARPARFASLCVLRGGNTNRPIAGIRVYVALEESGGHPDHPLPLHETIYETCRWCEPRGDKERKKGWIRKKNSINAGKLRKQCWCCWWPTGSARLRFQSIGREARGIP